jgi:outer membrane receptor protein involved in Fe transport
VNLSFSQNGHKGYGNQDGTKDGVVKGIIKSEQSGLNISYATITLYTQKDSTLITGTVSKDDGSFEINEVPYGKFYIVVDFIGFRKKKITDVKVFPSQKSFDCEVIKLADADQVLDEVDVVADKNQMQYKIDKKVVNVSQNISAAGGTVVDALESVPSVKVDADGTVSLRGSSNFTVLIDGKPSVLSGSDALNQIPASAVDNVEIITNPSAKYDPDGTSGIMNIIMKKNQKSGINGIVDAMVGTHDKYSGDFLLNYRTKKANFYLGAAYAHRNSPGLRNSLRQTFSGDSTTYLNTHGEADNVQENYSVKAGTDIYLNDKNTWTITGETGYNQMDRIMNSNYDLYNNFNNIQTYSLGNSNFNVTGNYYTGSSDFTHEFAKKGHKIIFSGYYSYTPGKTNSTTIQQNSDLNWNPTNIMLENNSIQDRTSKNLRIKSDYTLPISETQELEAGYQYQKTSISGNYQYSNFDTINQIWVNNPLMSNSMDFERDIHSLYATYSGKITSIEYKAGLRGEYTNQFLNQLTTSEQYKVNRFDFFPSFSVSHDFGEGKQIQAAYSRRVNRPQDWSMNPFPGMSDAYTEQKGNPALKPEFINSYDLSYQQTVGKQTVVLDAYYRKQTDGIDHIQTLGANNIMVNTFANIDKSNSVGGELSSNLDISKWLKIFATADVFYYQLQSNINDNPKNLSSTNSEFSMNTNMTFYKNTHFQINARYESPTVESQGTEKEMYRLDFSLKQDFLNKKLSLVLKAGDPFAISKHQSTSFGNNYLINNDFRRESRVYSLTLSYKINNYKKDAKPSDTDTQPNTGGDDM